MKTFALLTLAIWTAANLSACGGASADASAVPPPPPDVNGLTMPKSVAVVTAN